MHMEYRPEIGIGDRVISNRGILGTDRLSQQDFIPPRSFGVVVGIREGSPDTLFVDFDDVLHLVRRKVVMVYEVDKVVPTSLIKSHWLRCPWKPKEIEYGSSTNEE